MDVYICSRISGEVIFSYTSNNHIITIATIQCIIAWFSIDYIVTVIAMHCIIACSCIDCLILGIIVCCSITVYYVISITSSADWCYLLQLFLSVWAVIKLDILKIEYAVSVACAVCILYCYDFISDSITNYHVQTTADDFYIWLLNAFQYKLVWCSAFPCVIIVDYIVAIPSWMDVYICSRISGEIIVSSSAHKNIISIATIQCIIAWFSVDYIVTVIAMHCVIACSCVDYLVFGIIIYCSIAVYYVIYITSTADWGYLFQLFLSTWAVIKLNIFKIEYAVSVACVVRILYHYSLFADSITDYHVITIAADFHLWLLNSIQHQLIWGSAFPCVIIVDYTVAVSSWMDVYICAGISRKIVISASAYQDIISIAAVQRILPISAYKQIIAIISVKYVIAIISKQNFIQCTSLQSISIYWAFYLIFITYIYNSIIIFFIWNICSQIISEVCCIIRIHCFNISSDFSYYFTQINSIFTEACYKFVKQRCINNIWAVFLFIYIQQIHISLKLCLCIKITVVNVIDIVVYTI